MTNKYWKAGKPKSGKSKGKRKRKKSTITAKEIADYKRGFKQGFKNPKFSSFAASVLKGQAFEQGFQDGWNKHDAEIAKRERKLRKLAR